MTKNSFGLSKPLMLEILKMYWYVPVLSFVLYFFTGIFPILINIRRLAEMDYYIYNIICHIITLFFCFLFYYIL